MGRVQSLYEPLYKHQKIKSISFVYICFRQKLDEKTNMGA